MNFAKNDMALVKLASAADELGTAALSERGRGFASEREAWAEMRGGIENVKEIVKKLEKLHGDLWEATNDRNEDAFHALAGEFARMTAILSENALELRAIGDVALTNIGE